MAILTPGEVAILAPSSPLLNVTPMDAIAPYLDEAQKVAQSPSAANRPLELTDHRKTLRVPGNRVVNPNYYPISRSKIPYIETTQVPGCDRRRLPNWTPIKFGEDWDFSRRGQIELKPHVLAVRVRVAYVGGFDFREPEEGTAPLVKHIKRQCLAIAEQTYITAQSYQQGSKFTAIGLYEVTAIASGRIGPSAHKGDQAKIALRRY
ncbi:MAG: hypothetical protein AAGF75_13675, partial [Cyanobacteria bacterium P01_H01_bin.130]